MKIFRLLLLVTLGIAVTFVVGCDEAATMVKPVMEDHDVEPKPDTDISTLPVLSETEAREKARQVMRRLFQRGQKANLAAQTAENGEFGFGNFLKELNNIYIEETGIDLNFVTGTLLPIHKEENLEEANSTDDSLDNLVEEYVFISFRYPGKSQEELLALFRGSARAGNTTVIPERVEALYADLYKPDPEANASSFVGSWFRTGDQGQLDEDGVLTLRGRIKELINRSGEKISPLEIDEVLLSHPAVSEAVAFGVPHPAHGEEPTAAVVLGSDATERELVAHCRQSMASFKVPRRIHIVDSIPRTATGKVQRRIVAEVITGGPST